ncbi:hypothetical protein [Hungatella sp.]|uniref:hypothetical protein n=1 Tax=Hungatella sp. TaxID=2613924 RepID=UPI003996107D
MYDDLVIAGHAAGTAHSGDWNIHRGYRTDRSTVLVEKPRLPLIGELYSDGGKPVCRGGSDAVEMEPGGASRPEMAERSESTQTGQTGSGACVLVLSGAGHTVIRLGAAKPEADLVLLSSVPLTQPGERGRITKSGGGIVVISRELLRIMSMQWEM